MNNKYDYIDWKVSFTLSAYYQTMSNSSFNAKLITESMDIESNGILIMNYLVNGEIWLNTYTYVDQTYIKMGIHTATANFSLYIDYEKEEDE